MQSTAGNLIGAGSDREAIGAWLAQYVGRDNTFDAYRREAERFWSWLNHRSCTLADVTYEDLARFRAFLTDPPASLVNATVHSRKDPRWRPFRGPLSMTSRKHAESILRGMFSWLVEGGYLPANPFTLLRHPRGGQRRPHRFLTADQWACVRDTVAAMPENTPQERVRKARDRWMVQLMYYTAVRISEAAQGVMGDITPRRVNGQTKWSLTVVGKGDKERSLPLTAQLLQELREYRRFMGLSDMPNSGETTPLVASLRGGESMTRFGIYTAIKAIFGAASWRMGDADAAVLRNASPHWLRHTRTSDLVDAHVSLVSVRDLLGHANLSTTSLYAHEELDHMQTEIEKADREQA